MSLFSGKPVFGAAATSTVTPMFGSTAAPTATVTPLFGAAPAATSTPLFGTAAASTAPATGLFGATTTTTTATPLFGSTTSTTTSAAGTLFGASANTTAKPGLGGGGLFGSNPAPAATGGLFGATAVTAAAPSLGLGGVQQKSDGASGSTQPGTLLSTGDKEPTKEGDMQYANDVRNLVAAIQDQLKKNREVIEAMDSSAVDYPRDCSEMLEEKRGWVNEVSGRLRAVNEVATAIGQLAHQDELMAASAKKINEVQGSSSSANLAEHLKRHIFETTGNYEVEICTIQSRIDRTRTKIERLLSGKPALTMEELDKMFESCDSGYAFVQQRILDTASEIEATKNKLMEQGYTGLRSSYNPQSHPSSVDFKGPDFCPSQATLAYIGSCLKAPAQATTGLGLSTGGGLFGSTTTGGSLFGNTSTAAAASKPLFGSGSLFGNTTATNATTAAATTTTSAGGSSLFSSLTQAKPTTTFASTLSSNSSSGLLFSMKK